MRISLVLALALASSVVAESVPPTDSVPGVTPAPTTLQFEQDVLFEIGQEGHAWGYRHNGVIVTVSGEVHRFDGTKQPAADPDAFQLDTGKYGETQLAGNVPGAALAAARALIPGASEETLHRWPAANDAGDRRALAFTGEHQARQQVHLGSYGVSDWNIPNDTPAAMRLREWLVAIEEDVREDPTPKPRGGAGP